ncbi:hypothetical protein CRT60_12090 [Azospirillum palustre]|uniref:DUF2946 domain-containing protein n=1 Tax=Azospirillum palustre TaxID=2044885 RepID=A0A2B8BEP1_9PROT|nr:DUF2946 family protein [Azospirillum palustre]PGH57206.1 hypothetical protein CRT60_12090 [Azospirillum palustre]
MSATQDRLRPVRRAGLAAGAIALLLQIVAWAWMPAMIASANAAESGGIVICTPDGFKTVALDDHGAAGNPARFEPIKSKSVESDTGKSDPTMSGGSCPLCPLVGGLAMPPPDLRMAQASVGRHSPESLPGDVIAAGWFLSTLQARAPPV